MSTPTSDASTSPSTIPVAVASKVGFSPIKAIVDKFKEVSLHEMIAVNSTTRFPDARTKYCYSMQYDSLVFGAAEACEQHCPMNDRHRDAYTRQHMHSISGEQKDLCFYTYDPDTLIRFLEANKAAHYTYLPMTVHATDSANGYRHDMLLVFDNRTKLFYWFDGRNREDYLPFGRNIPKNAIDVLLINMSDRIKLGYIYEPQPSWVIDGVLQPFASVGEFDFVLSTAWCYLTMMMLDNFDSPTSYLSALDILSKEDRFHLLYNSFLHMVGVYKYHAAIPATSRVNLVEGTNMAAPLPPSHPVPSSVIPHMTVPVVDAPVSRVTDIIEATETTQLIHRVAAPVSSNAFETTAQNGSAQHQPREGCSVM